MKKRKFNARAMKKFTTEPKVVHEAKPTDLITQYNRMRSIATDIYNSDFFMISSKAEQKKIEASIACISATMISMIGMEAIENSHDCLPDDSGNGNDHSWDNLPDDSGNGTDTDKDAHDAIKKMMNIAYGKDETDGVKKAAARQTLNSMYGVLGSHDASNAEVEFSHTPYKSRHINDRATPIMAMNRRILSELGIKSPADKPNEDPSAFGNEYDEVTDDDLDSDEVKDYSEVNLGNFIDGSFYSDQYRALAIQYGFDAAETLKQFEKVASQYYIQMINLVDVVDSQDEITADKYTLEPGSVFFITNKKSSSKSPVFILVYMRPYAKTRSSDISKFSFEITPSEIEESTKTNYIEFINSDAYYNIGKVHLSPNTVIDLDTTLEKIKDEARTHGIGTITFVDTIGNSLDIFTEGKYTLEPGSLFCHRGNEWLNFMLIVEDKVDPDRIHVLFIEPVWDVEENASLDDIEFIGIDAYYNIDTTFTDPNYVINLDATLRKIKKRAKETGIKTITFVDTIEEHEDLYADGKYSLEPGSLFFVKEGYLRFILINETNPTVCQYIDLAITKKDDSNKDGSHDVVNGEVEFEYTPYESRYINDLATSSFMAKDDIEFVGADDYYKIDKACPNSIIIDLDATLIKIKEKAQDKGIKTITFVGIIKDRHEIYYRGKNSKAGSLYYLKNDERPRFILITGTIDYVNLPLEEHIDPVVIKKNDSEEDDIKFVCAYYYYKIDTSCPNSAIIDLDATLAKIKERARAKNIKTIKFAGTTKDRLNIYYRGNIPKAGSLYYLKNDDRPRFILITGTNDSVDLPQYEYIDPVMVVKKDDSEDESDSKEDGIEAVEAEDKIVDSDEVSIDHGINDRYANVDTNEISCDNYAKVSFSLFMESTENSENISFVDICNIYDFDVFATIKRIKSVAYLNDLESIKFAGTVYSHEEISEKEALCDNGSVLFVSDAEDPYFIIIKYCGRTTWLNRINPVEK